MWPALYYDTETSDYHEETSPSLPVQIAAILTGRQGRTIAAMSCIINQRTWVGISVNPIAERVSGGPRGHGITQRTCDEYGFPAEVVLNQFRRMLRCAKTVVAHNIEFDIGVMCHSFSTQTLPALEWPEQFCTMREAAPMMKMPAYGKYRIGGYKAPKLAEAYRWATGAAFENAHDAFADTSACKTVHRHILKLRWEAENPPQQEKISDTVSEGDRGPGEMEHGPSGSPDTNSQVRRTDEADPGGRHQSSDQLGTREVP